MASWTQTSTTVGRRSWRRPLGTTESVYYWNGIWNGTSDTVMHVHLRMTRPGDNGIHAPENVRRAWSSVKRRFPLIVAEVHEEDSGLHFIVCEQNVTSLREDEVTFGAIASFDDARHFIINNLDGPRPISSKLLTRVYVLRQMDQLDHFHVVLVVAHCITDGCSTSTLLRSFFQTLATSFDPCPTPIEDRLKMYCPIEDWVFPDDMPLTMRRWRRAIGYAFHIVRSSRLTGGHTLPGNFTQATASTPAKSRFHVVSFPRDISALIMSNCRHHKITLNSAYHIFSQVALSRLLSRRYLRGEISQEEWEYRKRQPMLYVGLVNLRSYWDRDWFRSGGSGEVGLNFGFYHHVLPFMPLGSMAGENMDHLELVNGAPLFRDLMSFDRFLLRCKRVKSNSEKLFRNPWFLEICVATHRSSLEANATRAEAWRRAGEQIALDSEAPQPISLKGVGPVFTQRGASLGDMDFMIPLDYPIPVDHALSPFSPSPHPHRAGYPVCPIPDAVAQYEPRLHVEHWQIHFRSRPGEIYMGAMTSQKELQYFTFYDENVHGADVIRELMQEMKEATMWYLGRARSSRAMTKYKL